MSVNPDITKMSADQVLSDYGHLRSMWKALLFIRDSKNPIEVAIKQYDFDGIITSFEKTLNDLRNRDGIVQEKETDKEINEAKTTEYNPTADKSSVQDLINPYDTGNDINILEETLRQILHGYDVDKETAKDPCTLSSSAYAAMIRTLERLAGDINQLEDKLNLLLKSQTSTEPRK